jgi:integrase
MGERYRAFTEFLVMTGTRFGEATAVTVGDVDLMSKPATMRINKAWKRGADSQYYIGATKTGAGKRTVSLNPHFFDRAVASALAAGREEMPQPGEWGKRRSGSMPIRYSPQMGSNP